MHFRVLAAWLLKFPVASQHPPDVQGSSRDMAPPDLTEEGCVSLLWQRCSSDKQNEKTDPLWFRFLSICKGFFFVSVTAKEMFGEACFLLHKKEDLESQEGKAVFALR